VYSKKVEYLYTLLYQTLDVLIERSKKRTSLLRDGTDRDVVVVAEPAFLLLNIPVKANVSIDDDDADYRVRRPRTMQNRVPVSMLDFDDDADGAGGGRGGAAGDEKRQRRRKRRQRRLGAAADANLRVNACAVHGSGALLLDSRDAETLDQRLERLHASKRVAGLGVGPEPAPFGSPRALIAVAAATLNHGLTGVDGVGGVERALAFDDADIGAAGDDGNLDIDDFGGMDMGGDMEGNDAFDGNLGIIDAQLASATGKGKGGGGDDGAGYGYSWGGAAALPPGFDDDDDDDASGDEHDPWAQLDPHDTGAVRARPFRKGRTYQAPPPPVASVGGGGGAAAAASFSDVFDPDPERAALERSIALGSLSVPYNAEFGRLYLAATDARRVRDKRMAKVRAVAHAAGRPMPASVAAAASSSSSSSSSGDVASFEFDDSGMHGGGGGFGGGMNMGGDLDEYGGGGGGGGGVGDGWDDPPADIEVEGMDVQALTALGMHGGVFDAPETSAAAMAERAMQMTYEDLCKQHVDAYVARARAFKAETGLSVRVAAWQARLLPLLEEEATHGEFDIAGVGNAVMQSTEAAASDTATDVDAAGAVRFDDVVRGAEQWEVCRCFLATLQLANNGNVRLHSMPGAIATGAGDVANGGNGDATDSLRVEVVDRHRVVVDIDNADLDLTAPLDVIMTASFGQVPRNKSGKAGVKKGSRNAKAKTGKTSNSVTAADAVTLANASGSRRRGNKRARATVETDGFEENMEEEEAAQEPMATPVKAMQVVASVDIENDVENAGVAPTPTEKTAAVKLVTRIVDATPGSTRKTTAKGTTGGKASPMGAPFQSPRRGLGLRDATNTPMSMRVRSARKNNGAGVGGDDGESASKPRAKRARRVNYASFAALPTVVVANDTGAADIDMDMAAPAASTKPAALMTSTPIKTSITATVQASAQKRANASASQAAASPDLGSQVFDEMLGDTDADN
jgi:condensin-2 complex subunit H2